MITIKLKPSFHNFSLITLHDTAIEYEILPTLKNLKALDKKESYLEKKEIPNILLSKKDKIGTLINHIIAHPKTDDRIILDGIQIECTISNDLKTETINFHSPDSTMTAYEIVKNLFLILNACFTNGPILNHIESTQSYFGLRKQWKITNKTPLTLRLFGSLSIHEKEEITKVFHALEPNIFLILDIRNLDGMGAIFHECFIELKNKMKAVFWLIKDRENDLLKRHFDEMKTSNEYIFTDKDEIIKKIKKHDITHMQ